MSVRFLDLRRANAVRRDALVAAATRVIDSGWYILGREVTEFERAFAGYCGAGHCIGVGNGLDALTLILRALMQLGRVHPGDEVMVPSNTFAATLLAVEQAGLVPVLVDPDPASHTLHVDAVCAALTARTRVLMPVHLYGRLAPMRALNDFAAAAGLLIVEDAAQSQGAQSDGRRAGAFGIAAGFSFYPGKNLGALGDAGAVTTSDDALAAVVRSLRNYGSSRKYAHDLSGVNSRLDEMQAALLGVKLQFLDDDNAARRRIAAAYREALADLPGLQLPEFPIDPLEHVWHLFVVRHARRDALKAGLAERGIETLVHYPIALADQAAWKDAAFAGASAVAADLAATVLSLPIDPQMEPSEWMEVAAAVRAVCAELSV